MRTIAVSGYFDPLHIGHIELFKLAKALGDKLIVIRNGEDLIIKKSIPEILGILSLSLFMFWIFTHNMNSAPAADYHTSTTSFFN